MLELKNICFSRDNKKILDNLSLNIDTNKFTAITGPNGSGKSTLAKIIMGIELPDSGTITFLGQDITNLDITSRAKLGIGFAFQQPVKFKGLTVKNLIEIASNNTVTMKESCDYLAEVGLCAKEYINRQIDSKLSGGELKRIEIAMILARKSALTIFDEPEAGIDLWSFNNLINIFEKIKNGDNRTIIAITHQERILSIADEVILLKNGKIADLTDEINLSANSFHCKKI